MKKFFALFIMCSVFFTYAEPFNELLSPIEQARLKVFGIKPANSTSKMREQRKFLNKYFSKSGEYDIYNLLGKNIKNAYGLYVAANVSSNGISKSVLLKDLPVQDFSTKVDSTPKNPIGYAIMYKWHGNKKLEVVSNKFKGKELCELEVLELEQNDKGTILKTSFQQFCFDAY